MRPALRHLPALTLPLLVGGCGRGRSSPPIVPVADPCAVAADAGAPRLDTVTVGADGPFAARQLYETLVDIDCEGRIVPGLAERWEPGGDGRTWTFTLAPDRRFADGRAIDAAAVAASWPTALNGDPMFVETDPASPLVLWVRLGVPALATPVRFADPALAVRAADSSGNPVGSGLYEPAAPGDTSLLRPRAGGPVLRIAAPAGDLRDALDAAGRVRIDLLISRDPVVLDYARQRSDLRVVPLPWDRTYLLLLPEPGPGPDDATRANLARDAVREEARAAPATHWLTADSSCRVAAGPGGGTDVVTGSDPVARELAERVVALAGSRNPPAWLGSLAGRGPLRVAPGPIEAGRPAFRTGGWAAAIVAVPRLPVARCASLPPLPLGALVVPLIESRPHLIARRGVPALRIQGDGAVRVVPDPSSR